MDFSRKSPQHSTSRVVVGGGLGPGGNGPRISRAGLKASEGSSGAERFCARPRVCTRPDRIYFRPSSSRRQGRSHPHGLAKDYGFRPICCSTESWTLLRHACGTLFGYTELGARRFRRPSNVWPLHDGESLFSVADPASRQRRERRGDPASDVLRLRDSRLTR